MVDNPDRTKAAFKQAVVRPGVDAGEIMVGGALTKVARGAGAARFIIRQLVQGGAYATEEAIYRGVVEGQGTAPERFLTDTAIVAGSGAAAEGLILGGRVALQYGNEVLELIVRPSSRGAEIPVLRPRSLGLERGSFGIGDDTARAGNPPSGPIVGGGAKLENLPPEVVQRVQAFANKHGVEDVIVGSRAGGTAGPASDFDYLIGGTSEIRSEAFRTLPRGAGGGRRGSMGEESGIDVFNRNARELDPERPHVIFVPEKR